MEIIITIIFFFVGYILGYLVGNIAGKRAERKFWVDVFNLVQKGEKGND